MDKLILVIMKSYQRLVVLHPQLTGQPPKVRVRSNTAFLKERRKVSKESEANSEESLSPAAGEFLCFRTQR